MEEITEIENSSGKNLSQNNENRDNTQTKFPFESSASNSQ